MEQNLYEALMHLNTLLSFMLNFIDIVFFAAISRIQQALIFTLCYPTEFCDIKNALFFLHYI